MQMASFQKFLQKVPRLKNRTESPLTLARFSFLQSSSYCNGIQNFLGSTPYILRIANSYGVQNILGYYVQGYKNGDANSTTPGRAQLSMPPRCGRLGMRLHGACLCTNNQ